MKTFPGKMVFKRATKTNTVIGVVATNARLGQVEATKVAQMSQDGLARVIRPAHTMLDGDTIFSLATGQKKADPSTVGAFAAEVISLATLRGVQKAISSGGLPGIGDIENPGEKYGK